jgi:alkylation response protein AidB-like acyl-CoA dehydrogenase
LVDFRLRPDEQAMVEDLGRFVDERVVPLQEKLSTKHESDYIRPDGSIQPELLRHSREIRRESAKRGFYAMHMPAEVGGGGQRRVAVLAANQEVFKRGLGFTLSVLASIEGPSRMLTSLSEEKQKTYLAPLIRGEKTTCFALTEPGAGSDVRNVQTTARLENGEWVLNGKKVFITNGPYADFSVVFARTGGEDAGLGAISAFLVDKDAPGFRVGEVMETIANNGLPCELIFEDCRIPEDHVIGGVGEGFFHALSNISDIRVQLGGMCTGLSRFALDKTIAYVQERHAFGRPIGKYQGVSFPIADSLTELRAAEMLALYTAWRIDEGEDAIQETSMTKLYCSEVLWNVVDRCIQAHGAVGVLRQNELERILRWARVMRIWEGTSEIQRWTIAKTVGL